MTASVGDGQLFGASFPDKVQQIPGVFRRQHKLRAFERPADGLDPDHPPGIDVHILKDMVKRFQFMDVSVIQYGGDLNGGETALGQKVFDTLHGTAVPARQSSLPVMGLFQTIDADGDGLQPVGTQQAGFLRRDQRSVGGHAVTVAQFHATAHELKQILPQKRLPSGQTDLRNMPGKMIFNIGQNLQIFVHGHAVHGIAAAAAPAVEAVLVAAEGQLQKKQPENGRSIEVLAVCGQLIHMAGLDPADFLHGGFRIEHGSLLRFYVIFIPVTGAGIDIIFDIFLRIIIIPVIRPGVQSFR